jgi:hypothetical protein
MTTYIDAQRDRYEVEPIWALPRRLEFQLSRVRLGEGRGSDPGARQAESYFRTGALARQRRFTSGRTSTRNRCWLRRGLPRGQNLTARVAGQEKTRSPSVNQTGRRRWRTCKCRFHLGQQSSATDEGPRLCRAARPQPLDPATGRRLRSFWRTSLVRPSWQRLESVFY